MPEVSQDKGIITRIKSGWVKFDSNAIMSGFANVISFTLCNGCLPFETFCSARMPQIVTKTAPVLKGFLVDTFELIF